MPVFFLLSIASLLSEQGNICPVIKKVEQILHLVLHTLTLVFCISSLGLPAEVRKGKLGF